MTENCENCEKQPIFRAKMRSSVGNEKNWQSVIFRNLKKSKIEGHKKAAPLSAVPPRYWLVYILRV